ncbi:hypothetical protein P886_2161 [Alteromonadaceae bacterium 2753L.S.0a.02]|nr:hypothetical protein P886_2161 [Alteromonadaceae bacterium 2753L.S.0a.02]
MADVKVVLFQLRHPSLAPLIIKTLFISTLFISAPFNYDNIADFAPK